MEEDVSSHPLKKKGVTPLMIGILLISFAIAVGVVIMNLGRAEVEAAAICPVNIDLHLATIENKEHLCYDSAKKELTFTVENGINIKVEGLIVNIIGQEKAETFELNEAKMARAGTYVGHIAFDTAIGGEIRQVKISPKVILVDQEEICQEKAVVVEEVKEC